MIDKAVIGITGGIGSGKSTVLNILKTDYNGFIIEADKVGHIVMEPGGSAYDAVINEFGQDIINPSDKTINRKILGNIVFNDSVRLSKLNAIIHPKVKEYIKNFIADIKKNHDSYLIFVEAALLIEDNYDEFCDYLWYIYADRETRFERVHCSRNMTREDFESILKNQLPEEIFRNKCNITIDNSNSMENTKEQIYKALNLGNGDIYGR